MNDKTNKEQNALRQRFSELSKEEQDKLITRLSRAIHMLGTAIYDCGFTNGQSLSMLAFTVADLITPPKGCEEIFFEKFLEELKLRYQEIDEMKKEKKDGQKG